MAFAMETSMLYGTRHVKWNDSNKRVRANNKRGMVSRIRFCHLGDLSQTIRIDSLKGKVVRRGVKTYHANHVSLQVKLS